MQYKNAKFLYTVIETAVSSVASGQSRQVRFSLTGPGNPLHYLVDYSPERQLVCASNDRDLFSGQPPSVLIRGETGENIAAFMRRMFQAIEPQMVDDYFEARLVLSFHPPHAKSPKVLVGNSSFGTLGLKPEMYEL